jgi:hypothetical protein
VVLQAESRGQDGTGTEVLRGPAHPGELLRRDLKYRASPVEIGLDLERPPLLGPVILDYVAGYPGLEIRQRYGDWPLLRGLLPYQAAGGLTVGDRPVLVVLLSRMLPQLGGGEGEEVVDRVSSGKEIVDALLASVLALG